MTNQLILELDETLLDAARHWAETRDLNLSRVVEEYLASLVKPEDQYSDFGPWTRSMIGIAKTRHTDLKDEYANLFMEKHS
jgi:hypothetical protein